MKSDLQTDAVQADAVRRTIDVDAPVERAFRVFTEGIGSWWNRDHHLFEVAEMVFEPRVGGNIIDVGVDGTECRWSRVLAYEPPKLVRFSWDIDLQWRIEPDPARASEIEVRFTAIDDRRTRVVLTHSHLDRHGPGWEAMRGAVDSGWDLAGFAQAAAR